MGRMALRLLVAFGLFVSIVTGWFASHAARALWQAPDAPLPTTVAAAPDSRWVVLEDAVLDCTTAQVQQRTTLALANDRSGQHPFVAHLAGADACTAARRAPLDGTFIGPFTRVFLRARQHLDLPPGGDLRVFSQFETPRLLRRALGWRLTWCGLSLLLTMLGVRALWAGDPGLGFPPSKSGRPAARG